MQPWTKVQKKKRQLKLPKSLKADYSAVTLPYQKWFNSVENCMKWQRTDFEDNIENIIWNRGVMDGKGGMWNDMRAEYMKK